MERTTTNNKERIMELLGSGLQVGVVATAMGCHQEHISRLMADPEFSARVVELRSISLTAATNRDREIDSIEDTLIDKVKEAVDAGIIYKPRELLSAFMIVNRAMRRGVKAQESIAVTQTVVNLTLPATVLKNFTINQQGEVVDVESEPGKKETLVTMPAHTLLKTLAASRKETAPNAAEAYEKVGNFLPTYALQAGRGI